MGSHPVTFIDNVFVIFYKCKLLKSIKKTNDRVAKKFDSIFRFINVLIAMNDRNELENHRNKIDPPKLIWHKETTSHTKTTFKYLHLSINAGQFQISLYNKRNS